MLAIVLLSIVLQPHLGDNVDRDGRIPSEDSDKTDAEPLDRIGRYPAGFA